MSGRALDKNYVCALDIPGYYKLSGETWEYYLLVEFCARHPGLVKSLLPIEDSCFARQRIRLMRALKDVQDAASDVKRDLWGKNDFHKFMRLLGYNLLQAIAQTPATKHYINLRKREYIHEDLKQMSRSARSWYHMDKHELWRRVSHLEFYTTYLTHVDQIQRDLVGEQ